MEITICDPDGRLGLTRQEMGVNAGIEPDRIIEMGFPGKVKKSTVLLALVYQREAEEVMSALRAVGYSAQYNTKEDMLEDKASRVARLLDAIARTTHPGAKRWAKDQLDRE